MPSTSPYQNNSYESANTFRPYSLPSNEILKALSAEDEYWSQGASAVKNVYDNALGLNLVTTDNRQMRDNFVKQSEQQLKKLSTMNLADPTIQRQGFNIFKPLLQDQDIVGEDHVVRNLQSELGHAQASRTKDNGKEYNPLSVQNLQYEQNLLSGPLNKRDGWRTLYGNTSTYTPQVDTAGEYKKIADSVKAEEIHTARVNGANPWYIDDISRKGVSKDRMLAAIQEMGSPQLKAQMSVEARNGYYKQLSQDPAGADQYYQNLAHSYYNTKLGEMTNQKNELYKNWYTTPDTSEYKETRNSLKTAHDQLDKSITDFRTKELPKILQQYSGLGDLQNLGANLSRVENLWQQVSTDNLAGRLAYESVSELSKPNAAHIAFEQNSRAVERIQMSKLDLQEKAREANLENDYRTKENDIKSKEYDLHMLEYLYPKGGKKNADGSTVPFSGGAGSTEYTSQEAASANLHTQTTIGEQYKRQINDTEEPLRASAISNLIGPDAYKVMQKNLDSTSTLGDLLNDTEMERATQLFKAYQDKHTGETIGSLTFSPHSSEATVRAMLSKMSLRDFKQHLSSLLHSDPDVASELSQKMAKENGSTEGVNFRSQYNDISAVNLNRATLANQKIKPALGDLAQYFPEGSSYMTDSGLDAAYKNYQKSKPTLMIFSRPYGTMGQYTYTPSEGGHVATPEEEKLYKEGKLPGSYYGQYTRLSSQQFKEHVNSVVDNALYHVAAESNVSGDRYVFDDKDNEGRKRAAAELLDKVALPQDTDMKTGQSKLLDFIQKNASHISYTETKQPSATGTLGRVRFVMENFEPKDADTQNLIDLANHTDFEVTSIPSKYTEKGNATQLMRFRGAVVANIPMKTPDEKGGLIKITNTSPDAGTISPDIKVDNIYSLSRDPKTGNLITTNLDKRDLADIFQRSTGKPLDVTLQNDPTFVTKKLTELIMGLEQQNKQVLNQK